MTSQFKLLKDLVGLSNQEAADFLDARIDTVKSWSSGRHDPPPAVLSELLTLWDQMQITVDDTIKTVERLAKKVGSDQTITLEIDGGWPCQGVKDRIVAQVIAELPDLDFDYQG